jgi:hypothetical protein
MPPVECSEGTSPVNAMNCVAVANRWKSHTSAAMVTADRESIPRKHRSLATGSSRGGREHAASISASIPRSSIRRASSVATERAEGGLGGRLVEVLSVDPLVVQTGPSTRLGVVALPPSEQEALDPAHGVSAVVLEILPDPHQVPQGLLLGGGDPDRGELSRPMKPSEVAGVDAVGFDPTACPPWDERRGDDVALDAEGAQQAAGVVAGAGLVAGDEPRARAVPCDQSS